MAIISTFPGGGGGGGGFVAQATAPEETDLLWIDTSIENGVIKYFNGTSWVPVTALFTD